jgi:glycosyltransferase involved in cell wall biosynthesis
MKILAFLSHPIQYFSPLWCELSARPGVSLKVCYFSRHGLEHTLDRGFGVSFAWDIDLLSGYESHFLPRRWPTRDPHDARVTALNRGFARELDWGPDVVFINGYAHINNWLVLAMCRRRGIPVLCAGDSNLRAEANKPAFKLRAKRAVLSQFLPRIDAFLATGGQTRAYFEHYGAPRDAIFLCPYSVDVDRFRRSAEDATQERRAELRSGWRAPSGTRIVMFCGKLVAWKRPLDLVRALARLERSDVRGVFVGDGPLRSQIEAEGGERVAVTGFVNQREIPVVLSLADVLVLSSEFEPYGMVVAEAQALGVPAIVSAACGCHGPESVVQDGGSGFVYATGDVGALAERLERLLRDAALHQRMSRRAREQGETQSQRRAADGFLAAAHRARVATARQLT